LDSGLRTLDSHTYNYNNANQRTRATLADGSYWLYQYDSLGQVISANKYWSDETPVAGQHFDYTFDNIGNRTQIQAGGDQNGGYLRTANYTNNTLNQITTRDVPGYVDIKGVSFATNTVTVNGQTAYRKVEYFRDELGVNNSSSALWTNLIVAATGQTSVTGNVFVAQTPEQFSYDADGNLTNDGRFTYTWDAENRLINLTSLTNAPAGSKVKLDFAYDAKGRRIQKIVSTWNGSAYVPQSTNKFVYDGWNLTAEVAPNNSLVRSYIWGNDLSGSPQGVGGVGGLLEVSRYGFTTTNCFVAYDGNGNVMALINAADGTATAQYDYDSFLGVVRATGPMAFTNVMLGSTKYYDWESGLYYYGHRYYKPSTGTWPNRDPIEELSFLRSYVKLLSPKDRYAMSVRSPSGNESVFIQNDPEDKFDVLGLCPAGTCDKWTINVTMVTGGGSAVVILDVWATLTADPKCCIYPESENYRYLGYGLGGGGALSYTYGGSDTFTTGCIPWSAHNGIGNVTEYGFGLYRVFEVIDFVTPRASFRTSHLVPGFSAGFLWTAGYWWVIN